MVRRRCWRPLNMLIECTVMAVIVVVAPLWEKKRGGERSKRKSGGSPYFVETKEERRGRTDLGEFHQEAWLPITESREGNFFSAVFRKLSSRIGIQALLVPLAFVALGW
ncbi:hypothetical protein LguiB_022439 [Lonicera macranthoides]